MRGGKLCALMITLALLAGCGGGSRTDTDTLALEMRTTYLEMENCAASGEVVADYGDRVYNYDVTLQGNGLEGRMEVTAPENVAGTAVSWSEDGTVLIWDGVSLETGELSPDGLSPVDGFPLLIECCCRGAILESCREELDGEEVLRVAFQNPDVTAESGSRVDVWARESDFTLLRAEVSWSGETILTYTFDSFALTNE